MSWSAFGRHRAQERILFTLALLVALPVGTYIRCPASTGRAARLHGRGGRGHGGILSMFTGGALSRMGIFALGIMPYISASIIIQLVASMYDPWKALKKEGEQGRKKLNQYTRYFTVLLATIRPMAGPWACSAGPGA
jgi:preprotein translocase subunit SecY